jgi:transcriptional regulator with XRE-family HTH domain
MSINNLDILDRITSLRNERGWSNYKLAKEANIPQATLTNLFKRNNSPTISTLESMCEAFGISLTQFFSDSVPLLTPEQKELLNDWVLMSNEQKNLAKVYIKGLLQKKA